MTLYVQVYLHTCKVSMAWLPLVIDYLWSLIFGSDSLEYYDAASKVNIRAIGQWYSSVKTPLDEDQSMKQLRNEAKNSTGKSGTRMYEYLERAMSRCSPVKQGTGMYEYVKRVMSKYRP